MGEADGLAEAAWEDLIGSHEIVVPLLLETGLRRERDNTLVPYRNIIRDEVAIRQRLKIRRSRAASGGAT